MKSPLEELREYRESIVSQLSNGAGSENFQDNYTEAVDQYFRRGLQESETGRQFFRDKRPFTIVALGGYGRGDLCLHSDIDIMILFGSKIPIQAKQLADEILLPLWDLGLDLGYGIRSIKDCINLSKSNFEVLTSIMDARFVCGDSPLYLLLMEYLYKKVTAKTATAFAMWLEDRDKIRTDSFGDATYLLEPHLKEGIGGLRDYHHILWLSKALFHVRTPRDLEYQGILSHNEYQELRNHLKFISLVRNHLHQLSGRKNDRLGFEYQEKIAGRLDFQDKTDFMGVEQFLGKLHSSMASTKSLHISFVTTHLHKRVSSQKDSEASHIANGLHLHQGEINFDSATAILSAPILMMDIFEQSSLLGCRLSLEAKRLVGEFLYLVDDSFRESNKAVQGFLDLLNRKHSIEALDQMFETGFLESFIPEFGHIKDRVQYDAHHIFPVGRHSLETVRHLKDLKKQKEILLLDIFSDLPNPESLFLAGLFHDIGKVGKDHAHKGTAITRGILKRFGYDKKGTEDILFLVKHHLLLIETATRRDLNDEKMVIQCSRTIGDLARLKMLYLLTWADSKATGPGAWNEWTANLVQELFFKIMHILERKELATPQASQKAKKTKAEIRHLMADRTDPSVLEYFYEVISPRYLLNTSPHDIMSHLEMARHLKGLLERKEASSFSLETREDETGGCWEVTFMANDRPGLFSDMAGVLALNNINILSAQIYTWRDGTAVDIFKVTNPLDLINIGETWKKVKRDLKNVFVGKLALAYRLAQKAAPTILSNPMKPSRSLQVVVDNESSDFFTVIEVFANDRVGLLYSIAHTLFNLRLDIRIAKIATKVDQVVDVFYVRDLEGQKVEDEEQVLEIKRSLLHELQQRRAVANS